MSDRAFWTLALVLAGAAVCVALPLTTWAIGHGYGRYVAYAMVLCGVALVFLLNRLLRGTWLLW